MATFDQLAEDQRAIIEIVLRQGRSYEQIGEMLDLPPARVRELARDALADLAPFTAEFVDPQWRGQLADYVLGQQTGPEAQATRGHLKRSEPGRIWAYSLIDALDDFYEEGDRPDIPVGEAGARSRSRERVAEANGDAAETAAAAPRRTSGGLSPAAQSALMRRRVLAGIGAVAVIALLVFAATQIFGGDDNSSKDNNASASSGQTQTNTGTGTSTASGNGQGQIVGQAVLAPIGKSFKGAGVAGIYETNNQVYALVRAQVPKSTGNNKYVLWLYNSDSDAVALAADKSDAKGNFQGAAPLPSNWQKYKFIDVTYQPAPGTKPTHGRSVMRGPLTAPQSPSGTSTGTGTTTTP